MNFKTSISAVFYCPLTTAFKTPMLCDVSKVHTGMGLMPKITHATDDENWGKPGFSKKVYAAASLTQKGGYVSKDTVIERAENQHWLIEVSDFQSWMLSFYKFTGTWKTTEIETNKIQIDYSYTLHFSNPLFYPFAFLFVKLFWRKYMHQVLNNIKLLIENNEPYLYN